MKVFVTGGAGYIGSVTSKALLDAGHDVVVFDNLELGHRVAVDPRAHFMAGDLRHAEEVAAAMHRAAPDAVMHFAAYALVGESCADPGKYFRNNVQGGINLVEAMLAQGVTRIVFSSTCATYGQPQKLPITEATPQNPTNPYGQSKLMFEQILGWYATLHGFRPVCLRYFNACGASGTLGEDHTPETHIIPNVLKVALGQSPQVTVFGQDYATPDGTCVRDYIHVVDLAQAHILALRALDEGSRTYNLGNGEGFTVKEVIETCREVTGHPIPAEVGPRRPGDAAELVASSEKIRRELGWEPQYPDLRTIVEHAWEWHRTHPHGYGD